MNTTRQRASALALGAAGLLCLAPFAAPALAMLAGIALRLLFGEAIWKGPSKADRFLLQASVVLLGFGMDIHLLVRTGLHGIGLSLLLLTMTFALGRILSRRLGIDPQSSLLVSAGTAICGGSAIAAVAASTQARREAVGMAMATVFLLNAVALLAFPLLGHWLQLTPETFGAWAGLAIHDVSSVVGAATSFDPAAVPVAVATKLGRTLWIVPVALIAAARMRRHGTANPGAKGTFPWFLVGFFAAALLASALPACRPWIPFLRGAAHAGFNLALLLIGLRIDLDRIRQAGVRLLLQGILQWVVVAAVSLAWIRTR